MVCFCVELIRPTYEVMINELKLNVGICIRLCSRTGGPLACVSSRMRADTKLQDAHLTD